MPLRHRGDALALVSELISSDLGKVGEMVLINYKEYRENAKRWSFTYFTCVFGSAVASALAGVVLKLDSFRNLSVRDDVAACLAALGALLVTLSTAGDFQRKWRANRVAANAMENLAYELLKIEGLDRNAVLAQIQEINKRRTEGIVGENQTQVAAQAAGATNPPPGASCTSDNRKDNTSATRE